MALFVMVAPFSFEAGQATSLSDFSFSSHLELAPIPEWLSDDAFAKYLPRDAFRNYSQCFFWCYEGHSFNDPDAAFKGKDARTMEAAAFQDIFLVNLSLWLVKPTSLQIRSLIQAVKGDTAWHPIWHYDRLKFIYSINKGKEDSITVNHLSRTKDLFNAMNNLQRRGSSVWIAIRTLNEALASEWWESRYLFLWVTLESIFGVEESHQETSFRLSQRIAFFLEDNVSTAERIYATARKAYRWRSKIAHGSPMEKLTPELSENLLFDTETLVRNALTKILSSPDLTSVFVSSNREQFLDHLVFQRSPA